MCVALHIIVALRFDKNKGTERASKQAKQSNKSNNPIKASTPSGANQSNSQTSQTYKLTKAWKYLHGCPNGFPMLTYCASVRGSKNISLSRLPHIVQSHFSCPALAAFCSVELSTLLYPQTLDKIRYNCLAKECTHQSCLFLLGKDGFLERFKYWYSHC